MITFNGDKLESYDPFNYPGKTTQERKKMLEDNYQEHLKMLTNLKDNYWKQLFKKHNKPFNEPSIVVHLPPSIPSQDNGYDCGVFLLSFAKCILFKNSFNFCTDDMIQIRDKIRAELEVGKINIMEERNSDAIRKRKKSMSKEMTLNKKKKLYHNE